MKLLIAYGSLGKLFHLKDFAAELERQGIEVRLVKDVDFQSGYLEIKNLKN